MGNRNMPSVFFIGWDVGGWNCKKNNQSRDAIVILDRQRRITGKPWRGNFRESINTAKTSKDWIANLFNLCQVKIPEGALRVPMAIDTPLGFPIEFMNLASKLQGEATIGRHRDNPYLFRQTDRRLYDMGFHPLSSIKDMIGSQATKGLHVLARFAPDCVRCGVWSDGGTFQAIEAYPSISYSSPAIQRLRKSVSVHGPSIVELLGICAVFSQERGQTRLARGLARLRQSPFCFVFLRLLMFIGDTCP